MYKRIFSIMIICIFVFANSGFAQLSLKRNESDFDPLVDIEVTVEVNTIRWLEEPLASTDLLINNVNTFDLLVEEIRSTFQTPSQSPAIPAEKSFYLIISINDVEFKSPLWRQNNHIYHPAWNVTLDVPDDEEFVDIIIQLWNHQDDGADVLCDLSPQSDTYEAYLSYSIATGHWTGDDFREDKSGYGRLNGCDDGSIYRSDFDSELWFTITQNDADDDKIPYWYEINLLGTNPEEDDGDLDLDGDICSTYWEYRWGYDPLIAEDHDAIDADGDSISNYEEFLTAKWYSDPFRKDVFVEQDIMDDGPNGQSCHFPPRAGELIQTAFDRQNIVFHLDNGTMGGRDIIPFKENVDYDELDQYYVDYFLHNDSSNWRRGVFHYGVVVYSSVSAAGFMYRPNAFQISAAGHDNIVNNNPTFIEDVVYGSAYIHELGHTFGFFPIPGHNRLSGVLGIIDFIRTLPYRSCMNYGFMYELVDYSDGSRISPDKDDWDPSRMRFDFFEQDW